ncbi:hypothetical protein MRX96_055741 [Rhipicephalus microplus]
MSGKHVRSSEDIYQPLAVDDEQPIFRARIGRRRSAMPPDEPAEDEEDVRVFTTRIGRRSNVSATSSVTRAASVVGTESDRRNLRHVLSDDISITPAARRPSSQSVSIELELPREWSVEPCRAESASAILRRPYRQRRSHWPRSRSRSPHRRSSRRAFGTIQRAYRDCSTGNDGRYRTAGRGARLRYRDTSDIGEAI